MEESQLGGGAALYKRKDTTMSYQALFWYVWEENMPELATSIVKCAIGKYRYRGDPQDVVQEVMLSAYRNWYSFDENGSNFKTWVLWLTKNYLYNLYVKRRLDTVSLFQEAEDGSEPLTETVSSGSPTPEEVILEQERLAQIWTALQDLLRMHGGTRREEVLRTMLALLGDGVKPSYRNIARAMGCSHTLVATDLKTIRATFWT